MLSIFYNTSKQRQVARRILADFQIDVEDIHYDLFDAKEMNMKDYLREVDEVILNITDDISVYMNRFVYKRFAVVRQSI